MKGFEHEFTENECYYIIKSSDYFDEEWYLAHYCEISLDDPIKHFLDVGSENYFNPSADFDIGWYISKYSDEIGTLNPLVYHIIFGQYEGKLTKPFLFDSKHENNYSIIAGSKLFDEEWFLSNYDLNDDVNPIIYYLDYGVKDSLNPSRDFDTEWYLKNYKDEIKDMNPFVHYILRGKDNNLPKPFIHDEYRKDYFSILKSNLFDSNWYCESYSIPESIDPIIHYLMHGIEKGLNPSPNFDTLTYNKTNPDVEKSGMNPFVHYINHGQKEGRLPKLFNFEDLDKLALKKTIYGKFHYYFLINDSNCELKQHFDEKYVNKFNSDKFIRDYEFKKYFFEKRGQKYFYFIVPDKSVICSTLLPFNVHNIKRNIDKLKFIPDFSNKLDFNCYWANDTHLNYEGANRLSFYFLNYIDDEFTDSIFKKLIGNCWINEVEDPSNLLELNNWSYLEKDKFNINKEYTNSHIPERIQCLEVPKQFQYCELKQSEHLNNPDSFTNLKALIYADSSIDNLKYYLNLYFKEIFIYWNKLQITEELLDWFEPDMVMEISTERLLENYMTPIWVKKSMKN